PLIDRGHDPLTQVHRVRPHPGGIVPPTGIRQPISTPLSDTLDGPDLHPVTRELADGRNYAAISTLLPSGRIQTQYIWVGVDLDRAALGGTSSRCGRRPMPARTTGGGDGGRSPDGSEIRSRRRSAAPGRPG